MKIFLENIFMCLVKFWKCYFPPPHNRKTTKTPPPTPPQQQQKNQRSKRESKKSKSQTNFITKISNENENEIGNRFVGSWCNLPVRSVRCDLRFVGSQCNSSVRLAWCDSRFVGSRCDDLGFVGQCDSSVVWRSWVFWVRDLSLSLVVAYSLGVWIILLELSVWIRAWRALCTSSAWESRWKMFEVKMRSEFIFHLWSLILRSNWKYLQFDPIYRTYQTCYFPENDFWISFEVKTNGPLIEFSIQ